MAYALGNGLGAAFGGMLCDTLGWRWAFGIQIPWIMAFLVATYIVTPDNLGPNLAKAQGKTVWQAFETFDFRGSAVVTITVTSLILGINLGGNVLSWTHPFVITCLVLTIVGGFSMAPVSRRAKRPVLPLHLLAKSPNSNLMWASLFFCICLNIVLFNVPLFLQAVRQTTPTVSGLYLVVPLVGVGLTSIFTGYFIAITRHMQPQLYVGQALLVIGVIGTISLNQHMPTWAMLLIVPWVNIGQGFYFPTTTIATLSLNTLEDQAVVVSTLGLFRCIGSILGVAVSSWILQNSLPFYLERIVKDTNPAVKEKIVQAVRGSVEAIRDLDPVHKGQVITAYAKAMRITFASGLLFAALVICLSWPLRLPRLRGEDDSDTESEVESITDLSDEEDDFSCSGALTDSKTGADEETGQRQPPEDFVGISRQVTRTSHIDTGSRSRRTSELRLTRETSRQALQLGRKASFDTVF
jgi:predicted MFS family arabinose efflux permease